MFQFLRRLPPQWFPPDLRRAQPPAPVPPAELPPFASVVNETVAGAAGNPFTGMFDEVLGPERNAPPSGDIKPATALEVLSSWADDAVQRVMDDPSSADHDGDVERAYNRVRDVLERKVLEKRNEMAAGDGVTTTGTLIIGGGKTGVLDAASNPSMDKLGLRMDPVSGELDHARSDVTGNDLDGAARKIGTLQADPSQRLTNAELELGLAELERESSTPFVSGSPAGPIELRPTDPEEAADWPPGAKSRIPILYSSKGELRQETIYSTENIDVTTDMKTEDLDRSVMSEEDAEELRSWGGERANGTLESPALMHVEALLSSPSAIERGLRVLVIGEGETAGLASAAADRQGGDVNWGARPAKPPSTETDENGNEVQTAFGSAEAVIKSCVEAGQEVPESASKVYREEMKKYHDELRSEADELGTEIEQLQSADDADKHQGEVARLTRLREQKMELLEPYAFHDFHDGDRADDTINVKPDPSGSGKVVVTRIDSETGKVYEELYDKVVTALEPTEGFNHVATQCENIDKMEVIWGGDPPQPVGLQSIPAGVRVLGSGAWELRDKIADPAQRKSYENAIWKRTAGKGPMDRGAPFGMASTAETVDLANPSSSPEEAADDAAQDVTAGSPDAVLGPLQTAAAPAPRGADLEDSFVFAPDEADEGLERVG